MPDPESTPTATEEIRHVAFISYSRDDNREAGRKWADWILAAIRDFEIPAELVGEPSRHGTVPAKLGEAWLDVQNLIPGGELLPALKEKLRQSRFLVLVGSPSAAKSEYVGAEVAEFVRLHGWERVIPVVVEGKDGPQGDAACWVPGQFRAALPGGELPPYVDVRGEEKQRDGTVFRHRGFTGAAAFQRSLGAENRLNKRELKKLARQYDGRLRDARFHLIAALTGLEPKDVASEASAAELKRQRAITKMIAAAAAVFLALLAITFHFYREAKEQRRSAERSLMMIGDAHEHASRALGDVVAAVRASGHAEIAGEAEKIAAQYFDDIEPAGDDDDSLHMRSVVMNGRGRLATRTGDFTSAEKLYGESLRLRRELAARHPGNPAYQHNVAVSLDNFGDLDAEKAQAAAARGADRRDDYARALRHYRESQEIARALVARSDAADHWRHDLAVSHLKVGDALFQGGDLKAALDEFTKGLPVAEALAARDRDYAKWQAHLALFCLQIGRIHATKGRDEDARQVLSRGKTIFDQLAAKAPLPRQHADWAAAIAQVLGEVAP